MEAVGLRGGEGGGREEGGGRGERMTAILTSPRRDRRHWILSCIDVLSRHSKLAKWSTGVHVFTRVRVRMVNQLPLRLENGEFKRCACLRATGTGCEHHK